MLLWNSVTLGPGTRYARGPFGSGFEPHRSTIDEVERNHSVKALTSREWVRQRKDNYSSRASAAVRGSIHHNLWGSL